MVCNLKIKLQVSDPCPQHFFFMAENEKCWAKTDALISSLLEPNHKCELTSKFIAEGANVNFELDDGLTCLKFLADNSACIQCARSLLVAGAQVDQRSFTKQTVTHHICRSKLPEQQICAFLSVLVQRLTYAVLFVFGL